MKTCSKCRMVKPESEYYSHKLMAGGFLSYCKTCTKKAVAARVERMKKNPVWVIQQRERARQKYHTRGLREQRSVRYKTDPEYRKKRNKDAALYRSKYPEKSKSGAATHLIACRPDCHKHHWSYLDAHRKDVIIVSKNDHALLHRFSQYDQERMQYRTRDGVLLDSRKSYLKWAATIGVRNLK